MTEALQKELKETKEKLRQADGSVLTEGWKMISALSQAAAEYVDQGQEKHAQACIDSAAISIVKHAGEEVLDDVRATSASLVEGVVSVKDIQALAEQLDEDAEDDENAFPPIQLSSVHFRCRGVRLGILSRS